MKKEQTEEQVQDHLQEETGGGNSYHSFEMTRGDKALTWIVVVLLIAVMVALVFIL